MGGNTGATCDFHSLKEEPFGKAWTDDNFQAWLVISPNGVLRFHGANIPDGGHVGKVGDTDLIGTPGGTALNCISVPPSCFTLSPALTVPGL